MWRLVAKVAWSWNATVRHWFACIELSYALVAHKVDLVGCWVVASEAIGVNIARKSVRSIAHGRHRLILIVVNMRSRIVVALFKI